MHKKDKGFLVVDEGPQIFTCQGTQSGVGPALKIQIQFFIHFFKFCQEKWWVHSYKQTSEQTINLNVEDTLRLQFE